MRVLLDTSYLYKLMRASGWISELERQFFDTWEARLYVSAVSIWEMRLKFRALHPSGARKSPYDPNDVVAALERQGVTFLTMTARHAACDLETPIPHKDPFDELLLVQAQEEGLKLLTDDRRLIGHPLAITA